MSSTTIRERREERAERKAQRSLERDYDRLRTDVMGALRGKLVAASVRMDDADLEVAYNLAWHALYDKLRAGETVDNPGGFLTQVSFFRAMDDFRAQRPGRRADVDLDVAAGVNPDVDARLDDRDQLRAFTEGLGQRLDGRERQAAVLCYLHGYSRPEAAEALGLPPARMEKVMDGVSKVVRGLVADLKQGGWCESQKSLMTAYALGVLAPEGQRREMAAAHLASCSGCRAHVRRLRGMGAMAPPFLLPWGAVGIDPLHLPAQILGGGHLVPAAPGAFAPLLAGGHGGAGVGAGAGGSGVGGSGGAGGSGAGGSGAGGPGWFGAGGSGSGGSGAGGSGGPHGNGPRIAVGAAVLALLLGGGVAVAVASDSGSQSPTASGYSETAVGGVLSSSPTAAGYSETAAGGVLGSTGADDGTGTGSGTGSGDGAGRSCGGTGGTSSGTGGSSAVADRTSAGADSTSTDASTDADTSGSGTGSSSSATDLIEDASCGDPSGSSVVAGDESASGADPAASPTATGYGESAALGLARTASGSTTTP